MLKSPQEATACNSESSAFPNTLAKVCKHISIIGELTKLRKATISFAVSVSSSTWNKAVNAWMDFHEIWYEFLKKKIH
jgi:hypothetical protein